MIWNNIIIGVYTSPSESNHGEDAASVAPECAAVYQGI